ncbi:NADPH-dependent FMN reductase [Bradyrhizobium liaoningense]|uniref:NADPH-dependent FMN reductase n=1 Tax=Bradyrhizobium liaoningense TaxID=43992 RepID=UPI001BA8FA2B|nr:NAD(P)H-dependent oxidoreductase [Bradyrhizobium liaoningense]MBR0706948.1 NAD(P)H-dependent oxidoreductase [Bradyrhizobium liaoningense]
MRLLFLSGSSRIGSVNWRLASAAADLALQSFADRIDVVGLDLSELDLPNCEKATGHDWPNDLARLKEAFDGVAGVFMSADEYTGSYSAILKNAIGWMRRSDPEMRTPFAGMQVALCGSATRGVGGLRGLPALRQLLRELGALVIPQHLELGTSESAFDGEGRLLPKLQRQLLDGCLGKLCALTPRPLV